MGLFYHLRRKANTEEGSTKKDPADCEPFLVKTFRTTPELPVLASPGIVWLDSAKQYKLPMHKKNIIDFRGETSLVNICVEADFPKSIFDKDKTTRNKRV